MKPVVFDGCGLNGHRVVMAEDQPEYPPLPAHRDGQGIVTTCWRMGLWEGIKAAFTGRIWLQVHTRPGKWRLFQRSSIRADLTRCAEALIAAKKCQMCPDQGWFQMETGGCNEDGSNDTRESVQMECEWCHTTPDSFFNATCEYQALFPAGEVKAAP